MAGFLCLGIVATLDQVIMVGAVLCIIGYLSASSDA